MKRLNEIVGVLEGASPEVKRAIYDELGVTLTYHPDTKRVRAAAGGPGVLRVRVGRGTRTITPRAPSFGWFVAA